MGGGGGGVGLNYGHLKFPWGEGSEFWSSEISLGVEGAGSEFWSSKISLGGGVRILVI